MKTKLIFIGTIAQVFFLLFSCKKYSQNVSGEGFACETIQLNNYTIRKMDLNDSISYEKKTYLKEKEHFIISSITKLRFCNFIPIIFDKPQKKIFIYDQDGNCFSMIDNIGRGPNEYLQVNDFCVDEASKSIYALVVTGGRKCAIYKYNLNGSLLGHSVLSFKAYKLEKLGNELFFYTDFSSDRRKGYNIYITNKEGQIINKHFPHEKRDQNWKSDINVFSVCNDTILFHPVFNDTIYKITAPEGIQASLVLRANDKSDNPDLLKKYCNSSLSDFMAYANNSKTVRFDGIVQNKDYLFFIHGGDNVEFNYVFDKNRKVLYRIVQDNLCSMVKAQPHFVYRDHFVSWFDPYEIHDFVDRIKAKVNASQWDKFIDENKGLIEIYNKSKATDNPVISIYRL